MKIAAAFVLVMAALASVAWIFQDDVALWRINPNRTYEAYTPSPAPDYVKAEDAWLARGTGAGQADVFFIHSNVYHGDGAWNAAYNRDTQEPFIRDVLIPLEAGPFSAHGRLWAPRYREPTLGARFTQKHPGSAARITAYQDVRDAFDVFLRERRQDRPFVVVGYGDGALFAGMLWQDRITGNPALLRHLVALYAVGMPLPERLFADHLCQEYDASRCVLGFTPVDERFAFYQDRMRERTLTLSPDGTRTLVSTSSLMELCATPPLPAAVEAAWIPSGEALERVRTELRTRCENGLLIVSPVEDARLRPMRFFGKQWLPDRVNLFYGPLSDDVAARINGALRDLAQEDNTAPPIAAPEEIGRSMINTIPE